MKLLYVAMPYDQGQSGISEYIRATITELSHQHDLILLGLETDLKALQLCLSPGHHQLLPVSRHWQSPFMNLLFFAWRLPTIVKNSGAQAVVIPAGNRRCLIQSALPVVTTVHDLAALKLTRKYDPLRQFYLQAVLPALLRRAGHLVAISEQTRHDLATLTKIQDVSLALNGCHPRFNPDSTAEDAEVLSRHGLQAGYLLYVARIEHPGKNHLGLIQAWQALPPDLRQGRELVFAGSDWTGAEQVHHWVQQNQPEGVRFLGFVADHDLPALYRQAVLYVQPSLYEGFGLPIVEAMASGIPVLSSNQGALPEIGGQAVRLSEPDPKSLSEGLRELLNSPALRQAFIQAGLLRARAFSWQRHAEILTEILSRALDATHADGQAKPLQLLGLNIYNGTQDQAIRLIQTYLNKSKPSKVFFINADCLNLSCTNPDYRQALKDADLCLPDGSGVALGARLTGQELIANLNGTDLFPVLCEQAQAKGYKVWFLGGRPGVPEALVQNLQTRWPKLKIAGWQHGYTDPHDQAALLKQLKADQPDILFVALGAPLQELWIQRHAAELNIPLMLGVGGLFDFYSGRIPRAPEVLRKLGMEWCWRLLQEPARLWKRYLIGNPLVITRLLRYGQKSPVRKSLQELQQAPDKILAGQRLD